MQALIYGTIAALVVAVLRWVGVQMLKLVREILRSVRDQSGAAGDLAATASHREEFMSVKPAEPPKGLLDLLNDASLRQLMYVILWLTGLLAVGAYAIYVGVAWKPPSFYGALIAAGIISFVGPAMWMLRPAGSAPNNWEAMCCWVSATAHVVAGCYQGWLVVSGGGRLWLFWMAAWPIMAGAALINALRSNISTGRKRYAIVPISAVACIAGIIYFEEYHNLLHLAFSGGAFVVFVVSTMYSADDFRTRRSMPVSAGSRRR